MQRNTWKEREAIFLKKAGAIDLGYYNSQVERLAMPTLKDEDVALHYLSVGIELAIRPNQWYVENKDKQSPKGQFKTPLARHLLHLLESRDALNQLDQYSGTVPEKIFKCLMDEQSGTLRLRDFCSYSYAYFRPDVVDKGLSPFLHMYLVGVTEKRSAARLPPHIVTAVLDSMADKPEKALQYFSNGLRKLENPSSDFDPKFYINFYNDVKQAKIHPVVHYYTEGKREDRLTKDPWANTVHKYRHALLERQKFMPRSVSPPLGQKSSKFPQDCLDKLEANNTRIWLSVSHDSYTRNSGGVQSVVAGEQELCQRLGNTHLHICPVYTEYSDLMAQRTMSYIVTVNGQEISPVAFPHLIRIIRTLHDRIVVGMIHSLFGSSLVAIDQIVRAADCARWNMYIHDFHVLCENYKLHRNGVEFCNAPSPSSNACQICQFGSDRALRQSAIECFIEANEISVFYNSDFSKDYCESRMVIAGQVRTPIAIGNISKGIIKLQNMQSRALKRIAFIGPAVEHKGWAEFVEFSKAHGHMQFMHVFSEDISGPREHNQNISPVIFKSHWEGGKNIGLIDVLKSEKIDAVWMVRNCAETFSITMFEAIDAGCAVITNNKSGNIFNFVKSNAIPFWEFMDDGVVEHRKSTGKSPLTFNFEPYGRLVGEMCE